MSNFKNALQVVLKHEGGFTNDPQDPGGPTNLGLTFSDMVEMGLPQTTEQIKSLTPESAAPIYYKLYWQPMRLDDVQNDMLALCIFDQCVLSGRGGATRAIQSVACPNEIDGVIGPKTIQAINSYPDQGSIAYHFLDAMDAHYRAIVASNGSLSKFLPGWINRLNDLRVIELQS